ncbi:MAG: hypothetical protein AMXMBFR76_17840 [Pseudomonadota bacterium]
MWMLLRAPKMYGAMRGFQNRVWWPKWTPASSNWRMEMSGMIKTPNVWVEPPRIPAGHPVGHPASRDDARADCVFVSGPEGWTSTRQLPKKPALYTIDPCFSTNEPGAASAYRPRIAPPPTDEPFHASESEDA